MLNHRSKWLQYNRHTEKGSEIGIFAFCFLHRAVAGRSNGNQ